MAPFKSWGIESQRAKGIMGVQIICQFWGTSKEKGVFSDFWPRNIPKIHSQVLFSSQFWNSIATSI